MRRCYLQPSPAIHRNDNNGGTRHCRDEIFPVACDCSHDDPPRDAYDVTLHGLRIVPMPPQSIFVSSVSIQLRGKATFSRSWSSPTGLQHGAGAGELDERDHARVALDIGRVGGEVGNMNHGACG